MKIFVNKSCAGVLDENQKPLSYAEVASKVCLQQPPLNQQGQPDGFTPDEMTKRIKIQGIIDKGGKTIELEDADVAKLLECINATKWTRLDKDILQFVEDMKADLTKTDKIPAEK